MNKGELIDAVAASTGLSKADAGRAIDATTSAIAGELASGGSCALVGFGTFSVKDSGDYNVESQYSDTLNNEKKLIEIITDKLADKILDELVLKINAL